MAAVADGMEARQYHFYLKIYLETGAHSCSPRSGSPAPPNSQELSFLSSLTAPEVSDAAVSKQGHEKCREEHVSGLRGISKAGAGGRCVQRAPSAEAISSLTAVCFTSLSQNESCYIPSESA